MKLKNNQEAFDKSKYILVTSHRINFRNYLLHKQPSKTGELVPSLIVCQITESINLLEKNYVKSISRKKIKNT